MKRGDLLRHLRKHGCHLKREGRSHSLWTNPATGAIEAVPPHGDLRHPRSEDMPRPFCPGDRPVSLLTSRLSGPAPTGRSRENPPAPAALRQVVLRTGVTPKGRNDHEPYSTTLLGVLPEA